MTAVNAGRVELDIVAIARDQVTATLREVNKGLTETKTKVDELSTKTSVYDRLVVKGLKNDEEQAAARRKAAMATRDQGEATQSLSERVQALNKVKERAMQVMGLAGFAGAAFAAVGGMVELAKSASDYGQALADVERTQDRFNQLLAEVKDGNFAARLAAMGAEDAKRAKAQADHNAEVDKNVELQTEIEKRRLAILEADEQIEELRKAGNLGLANNHTVQLMIADLEDERRKLAHEQALAQKEQANQADRLLATAERLTPEFEKQAKASRGILAAGAMMGMKGFGQAGSGSVLHMELLDESKPPRGGGDSGPTTYSFLNSKQTRDRGDGISDGRFAGLERNLDEASGAKAIRESEAATLDWLTAMGEVEDQNQRDAEAMEKRVEQYRNFADVLDNSINQILPETGALFERIGEQVAMAIQGEKGLGEATAGSAAALIGFAGQFAKTKQARFAIRAAEEIAEGISTAVVNPVESASHFAGAVAFGVAAATAGGSAGGGRGVGGGGSGPSRLDAALSSGGPSTVVYNVNVAPGTDPQSVARALTRTNRSAAGTGIPEQRGW